MSLIKIKPVSIGWMLKCSVAGKHIETEFQKLEQCLWEIKNLSDIGETFVGQITIIPIFKYVEIIKQR